MLAARDRLPRHVPGGVEKTAFAEHIRGVVMAMFDISHTINTRVGDEYVRGVNGGERKRVTIAEATLSGAPLQCWDNSTRGLDSANAIEFSGLCESKPRSMETRLALPSISHPRRYMTCSTRSLSYTRAGKYFRAHHSGSRVLREDGVRVSGTSNNA